MRNDGRGPGAAGPGAPRPGGAAPRAPRHGGRGIPGPGPVPRRGGRARAGRAAADLGAIQRSGELIELLASRRIPARALGDPALALLSSLTADVDDAAPAAWRAGARHRAGRACPAGAWPHAAAAAALAAAIATVTAVAAAALVVVGMFARLRAARRPRC